MSVKIISGNLFESGAQTLVNATNIQGIMGGGIALAFKNRFPMMYQEYLVACQCGKHTTRRPFLWRPPVESIGTPCVLNIATKDYVRNDSTLENVEDGMLWLVVNHERERIQSLAIPALGCGLGGLDWGDVAPLICYYLHPLDVPVLLYEPL